MKLIGITGPSSFSNEVIRMVEDFFGSNPVLLYMDGDENIAHWLDRVGAVILAGGVDIHPMTYQRSCPAKRNMRNFDLRRDRREMKIIDGCIARKLPMLGICRGHQLLGVYRKKMTLITDLCDESSIIHCPSLQEPKYSPDPYTPVHRVEIAVGKSLFGGTAAGPNGGSPLWVNSFHHQGLLYEAANPLNHEADPDIIGKGFVSKEKSIVELMECRKENWISCQWHPEYDYKEQDSSRRLLRYFKDQYVEKWS